MKTTYKSLEETMWDSNKGTVFTTTDDCFVFLCDRIDELKKEIKALRSRYSDLDNRTFGLQRIGDFELPT